MKHIHEKKVQALPNKYYPLIANREYKIFHCTFTMSSQLQSPNNHSQTNFKSKSEGDFIFVMQTKLKS